MKTDIFASLAALPSVWQAEAKIEWVVDGMITVGSVNLFAAESGTGKTWLAYSLGGCVARGVPFAGHAVKQMPVLYIDGENPLGVIKDRLGSLGVPETSDFHIWGGWVLDDPPPGPDDPRVHEFAEKYKGLIIWDSFIEFHPGEESSASETRQFMKSFRNLANKGATVLILHNAGKAGTSKKYRGSSDIKAAVDTAYTVEKVATLGDGNGLDKLRVRNFKARYAEGRHFGLQYVLGEGFRSTDEPVKDDFAATAAALQALLTEVPINGTEFKRLAATKGISRDKADRFLKDWQYQQAGSKANEKLYFLPKAA
jgi:hypothetical protein